MNSQVSRLLQGLILALLILLGFSHKGSYGEIPVSSKALAAFLKELTSTRVSPPDTRFGEPINSLFIRENGLIILIEHNQHVTHSLQQEMGTREIPLILCASVLPSITAQFDPGALFFKQKGREWRPTQLADMVVMGEHSNPIRYLSGEDASKMIIFLPAEFELSQPITVGYENYQRAIQF